VTDVQKILGVLIALMALLGGAVKYGRDQEIAERERNILRDRIRAIERLEYSEHPEWAAAIYFATGEKPETK
jgi:hypothetical protein